ncbi:MAG: hypothetical protein ACM3Q1_14835 [Bacteroidales bacterium]
MGQMRICGKIYSAVAILAATMILVGSVGILTLWEYHQRAAGMKAAANSALLAAKVDGLIYAVSMDSRGIYMSRNSTEAEKFALPLLRNLDLLRETMGEWAAAGDSRRATFAEAVAAVEEFIHLRTELVRLSREAGIAKAQAFGDNDANRENRRTLTTLVQRLSAEEGATAQRLGAEMEVDYAWRSRLILIALAGGLAVGIAISSMMVSRAVTVPAASRNTPISSDLARAVQVFKNAAGHSDPQPARQSSPHELSERQSRDLLQAVASAQAAPSQSADRHNAVA